MALSIKTKEADRLARELSQITGESITETVTKSLAERLERERKSRMSPEEEAKQMLAYAAKVSVKFDRRPVTKAEWDEASGDTE